MDISKIEASLTHGTFLTGKKLKVLYICFIVTLLFPLITIFIIITILADGMEWDNDILIGLISGNAFSLLLFSVLLWVATTNDKLRKKIVLWVEDSIELKASVKRLDIVNSEFKPYQVQVDFQIDEKEYHKISDPGNIITGYHKIFAKYANKKIKILYSPKYDEVLILKDK